MNNHCKVCNATFGGRTTNTCPECIVKGYKWCKTCNTIKAVTDFPYSPGNGTWDSRCRLCHNEASKLRKREIRSTEDGNEHANAIMRDYNYKHSDDEAFKAYRKMYCYTNRRKAQGKYTPDEWLDCLKEFNYECAYCGNKENLTIDHIVAISKGGYNCIFNIVPACHRCNSSKQATDVVVWYTAREFYDKHRLIKIHVWYHKNKKMEGRT